MVRERPHATACKCSDCSSHLPFQMPEELYRSFAAGDVVLFVGAGVSTERRKVFPFTLYEEISEHLGADKAAGQPFPDLMSAFCAAPNGRANLLKKIRNRFEYIQSFPELHRMATLFHRELSTIYTVKNIITTNWDTYFEQECGAIPFVTAEDFAFSEIPGRKVFKIHGSIQSYGSVVATREDYELCFQRLATGLLGSTLKVLLATRTLVYVGFSFRDDDFIRIHDALTSEMRGLRPHGYVVSVDGSSFHKLADKGFTPICTDGTFFLSKVKDRLVREGLMVPDERFAGVSNLMERVQKAHRRVSEIDSAKYPDVLFGLCYQDGLMHALERIIARCRTGEYSEPNHALEMARKYQREYRTKALEAKSYHDVAYIDGYIDGLLFLTATDRERRGIPIYYTLGGVQSTDSFEGYMRLLETSRRSHKPEHRWAVEVVRRKGTGKDLIPHHTPFL